MFAELMPRKLCSRFEGMRSIVWCRCVFMQCQSVGHLGRAKNVNIGIEWYGSHWDFQGTWGMGFVVFVFEGSKARGSLH